MTSNTSQSTMPGMPTPAVLTTAQRATVAAANAGPASTIAHNFDLPDKDLHTGAPETTDPTTKYILDKLQNLSNKHYVLKAETDSISASVKVLHNFCTQVDSQMRAAGVAQQQAQQQAQQPAHSRRIFAPPVRRRRVPESSVASRGGKRNHTKRRPTKRKHTKRRPTKRKHTKRRR